jgi:hypothetical protein
MSVGVSNEDRNLDTNKIRLSYPNGFVGGELYTFKGQITFEQVDITPMNFFFDPVNLNLIENETILSIAGDENTMMTVDSDDNRIWSVHVINDSRVVHFTTSDGLAFHDEMIIQQKTGRAFKNSSWRVIVDNADSPTEWYIQFSLDGRRFVNQFIISNNEDIEDDY